MLTVSVRSVLTCIIVLFFLLFFCGGVVVFLRLCVFISHNLWFKNLKYRHSGIWKKSPHTPFKLWKHSRGVIVYFEMLSPGCSWESEREREWAREAEKTVGHRCSVLHYTDFSISMDLVSPTLESLDIKRLPFAAVKAVGCRKCYVILWGTHELWV